MKKTLEINVYTDGACSGNPGPGGIGYVIVIDDEPIFKSNSNHKGYRRTTNNRMEILAVSKALRAVNYILFQDTTGRCLGNHKEAIKSKETDIKVNVYSDSQLVVETINQGWKRKSNLDLWTELDCDIENLTDKHDAEITFVKVKGHNGNKWNEEADRLAVQASQGSYEIDMAYERISQFPAENETFSDEIGSSQAMKEPEIVNISLIGQNTPAKRIVEILLSNGTTVTVLPCHGGFEQTGCTRSEAAVTVDVAWRFVGWLNGRGL